VSISIGFGKKRRPNVAMIYVKTVEGRRAYYEGRIIPTDKFVPVPDVPFIRRLIDHHHDLEVRDRDQYETKRKKPAAD
jgi:hypothetical protein